MALPHVRLGILLSLIMALLAGGAYRLAALNNYPLSELTFLLSTPVAALVGGMILVRQPRNPVGWFITGQAWCFTLGELARQYALYGVLTNPGALPAAYAMAWPAQWLWGPAVGMWAMVPLYFPNGRLPGSKWRAAGWYALLAMALTTANMAFARADRETPGITNPLGLFPPPPPGSWLDQLFRLLWLSSWIIAALSLAMRFWRARGEERLQIKWLLFALAFALIQRVALHNGPAALTEIGTTLSLSGPWVAIGIAILRYRLYDIDLLINRALVYGILSVCIGGLYALVVIGAGTLVEARDSPLLDVVAAGVAAVAFAPLRARLQQRVDRLLYGDGAEPYSALTRLGRRLEAAIEPESILPTIVQTVSESLRVPYAAIALHSDERRIATAGQLVAAEYGRFPADLPADSFIVVPLAYQGQTVGELRLAAREPGERLSGRDLRLLRDLAQQAGAAVRTVQLTIALQAGLREVRRSQERLITVQEEERRRIQRDLHDGLGPILAGMRLRLEVCLEVAQTSAPALACELERLDDLVSQATADIRRLVYNLRPPALDQLGLVPALRQYAERFNRETGITIKLCAANDLALSAAVEVAIFRIVQEALTNVQKHAQARRVHIRLNPIGEALLLSIADDGIGGELTAGAWSRGTGIASMRERAGLLNGTLVLYSRPGAGTTIEVYLPVRREDCG